MKVFVGVVGSRKIIGIDHCSVRIRERVGSLPCVFLRYPDRIEEWVLEERDGELHLGGLVAANQRRWPENTVEVRHEERA